jgi:HAD superfamily hydrolase (TIGR01490 family)
VARQQFQRQSADVADLVAEIDAGPTGADVGAYFDLDGTLVDGFTAVAHAGHRVRNRQSSLGELTGVLEAAVRYRLGRMEFERLLTRAAGYLRGDSLAELTRLNEDIFVRRIAPRIFPEMRQLVVAHQERGHTVVLSSSALTIHAAPVAEALRISNLICNHFEVDGDGLLTGRIVTPVIWGSAKAYAAQEFGAANGIVLQKSYFYSDGEEDLPLMRAVGHPRPVNPRRELANTAATHNWPVLHLTRARRPAQ